MLLEKIADRFIEQGLQRLAPVRCQKFKGGELGRLDGDQLAHGFTAMS
jgi:hypothetical protein